MQELQNCENLGRDLIPALKLKKKKPNHFIQGSKLVSVLKEAPLSYLNDFDFTKLNRSLSPKSKTFYGGCNPASLKLKIKPKNSDRVKELPDPVATTGFDNSQRAKSPVYFGSTQSIPKQNSSPEKK